MRKSSPFFAFFLTPILSNIRCRNSRYLGIEGGEEDVLAVLLPAAAPDVVVVLLLHVVVLVLFIFAVLFFKLTSLSHTRMNGGFTLSTTRMIEGCALGKEI